MSASRSWQTACDELLTARVVRTGNHDTVWRRRPELIRAARGAASVVLLPGETCWRS